MFRFVCAIQPGSRIFANIRRQHKPKDVITIFHKPSIAASTRALNLLKKATAQASETAKTDQASGHSGQNKVQRNDIDLEVSEESPTGDQLRNILQYIGADRASLVVRGASSVAEAVKKLEQDTNLFQHPVVSLARNDMVKPSLTRHVDS